MSIVIRVFDENGHIGYLGFNADGPYITTLDKAYEYDDFEDAKYDAQRFAMENFAVYNTCPVVEEVYQRYEAVVGALNGWDIVSHAAADPSGSYGIIARKANYAVVFHAMHDKEYIEIYDRTDDGLPEQGIGYDTLDGDEPFTSEDLAYIIAWAA